MRAVSYLDFTSFHQCAMKFLFGPLCICTCLKCYKTKTLQAKEKGNRGGGKEDEWSLRFEFIFIDTLDKFQVFCLSTLDPLSLKMISTSRILPNC